MNTLIYKLKEDDDAAVVIEEISKGGGLFHDGNQADTVWLYRAHPGGAAINMITHICHNVDKGDSLYLLEGRVGQHLLNHIKNHIIPAESVEDFISKAKDLVENPTSHLPS